MSSIKYKYAFDESRKIVSIDSVTDADRYNHTYYCISCGAELKPRLGSKNVHHFYHVNADASCSGETYLHTLAKYRLKDRFDSSEEFKISLYQYRRCVNSPTCIFSSDDCRLRKLEEFNLKEYYKSCSIEGLIEHEGHQYRADLLLCNGKESVNPLLIEIYVKHKSVEQKIKSGLRIIELRVKSEEDIDMYCSDGLVETLKDSSSCQNVKFYGFKKTSNKKLCANAKLLQRFVLHRSGCAYVDYLECKYLNRRSYENSLIEYNVYCNQFADVYIPCLLKARGSGIAIKNCLLCKFYKGAQLMESLCALSKKFGTPRHPKQNQAQSCNYYSEDHKYIEESCVNTLILIDEVES